DKGLDVEPIRYADFGFNVPGTSIVANTTFIREKPELVRGFVVASMRAMADAERDPQGAIDSMLRQGPEHLRGPVELGVREEIFRLHHTPRTQGKPSGWMAPEDWEDAINLLAEHAGLTRKPRVQDVYSDEFVPAT